MKKKLLLELFSGALFGMITFIVALSLSWLILAQNNFLYGVWHDLGGIGDGIEKFGPANLFKSNFADTSKSQRVELFSQINEAVHNGGKGLEEIEYSVPGHPPQKLLRPPEIVHLQDVANLIDFLKIFSLITLLVWLIWGGLKIYKHGAFPNPGMQVAGMAGLVSLSTLVILLIGAKKVFYQFHIWFFPADHQWFFYYQESLMSTMMMAPTLFGYIAVTLILLSVPFFFLIPWACSRLIRYLPRYQEE